LTRERLENLFRIREEQLFEVLDAGQRRGHQPVSPVALDGQPEFHVKAAVATVFLRVITSPFALAAVALPAVAADDVEAFPGVREARRIDVAMAGRAGFRSCDVLASLLAHCGGAASIGFESRRCPVVVVAGGSPSSFFHGPTRPRRTGDVVVPFAVTLRHAGLAEQTAPGYLSAGSVTLRIVSPSTPGSS